MDSHLLLQKIIGFKGSTNDRLAEVKGTGNKIMNLLSTLAFLFENEQVSFIKPRIEYEKETAEISLDLNIKTAVPANIKLIVRSGLFISVSTVLVLFLITLPSETIEIYFLVLIPNTAVILSPLNRININFILHKKSGNR
ncbi:hypothetical protein ACFTQL_20415 [Peribacillus butanolivorans]|uniref:hypothetical protein n=1 Tax=Peribacillus butanolivorans TaxID=421767 RepID=UPI00362A17AC